MHIKIKADEVGMDAILSKTVTKATPTTQKTIEVGKQAPIAKMVTPQEKKAILKQKTIDNE